MEMNEQNGKLSAEVEPFVPQKKGAEAIPMALPSDGGSVGGLEATPIPSYLITCYPFVQENQSNRQFPPYNNDIRWQQSNSSPAGPYLAYPIISTQPPVSQEYMYYQLMPAPCAQVMGFYHPFPTPYTTPLQGTNALNAVSVDCSERANQQSQINVLTSQRNRNIRAPLIHKPQQVLPQPKCKRPPMKSVAIQKETCASGPDARSKIILLMDACQQTGKECQDFPHEIANKTLCESVGATPWKSKGRRRRLSHPAAESSSEQGASEADIDSDSGYCSPKHCQAAAMCTRHADCGAVSISDPAVSAAGGSWASVASQATQKRPWNEKVQTFSRGGRQTEIRNNAQLEYRLRGQSTSSERRHNLQRKQENKTGTTTPLNKSGQSPDHLYFEDEDEFPELNSSNGARNDNAQTKIPTKGLKGLPENSPINIVQTPIPITTSVPKRAKSQKKKALAAALATAQEYSEISMEQKKLQEALSKASGKKSKTPVQLDLGDMLAELERQQQAMKARQITNTRPLSYTVGSAVPFHIKEHTNRNVFTNAQSVMSSPNPLDSTAPRVKRGKEKEIPKLKRPTALKKIILKEREEKKGRVPVDPSVLGSEEQKDALSFADEQSEELASQEEAGLSAQSDTSLSPASQNSPYCMTPVSQGSPASSGIGSPMATSTLTKIHSKRFREYCNQVLSKEIDECVTVLLQELVSFQERVYQNDPVKAKSKRRLVMGLREVTKHMKLNKIKCVIISPNCEKIQSKGGLDEALYNVIAMAREQEIPFVFALGRKALGRCVNKLVPVSVVGIFSYSGAENFFHNLVSLTEEARKAYKDMVASMEQEQAEEALKNIKKVPHMGHSRNPSAASAISFCSVISEPISEVNEKDYETNWRRMMETSDGLETSENEECSIRTTGSEQAASAPSEQNDLQKQQPKTTSSTTSSATLEKPAPVDKEEVKQDDNLEWASQQSTETGSWDGSGRDVLNSSMTSTASTLVPEMLEEDDDDEEEDDDEYPQEPNSVSRIESWVSETQRTMESLQLVNSNSPEEDNIEPSEENDVGQCKQSELADCKERTAEIHARNGSHTQSGQKSSLKERANSGFM